MNPGNPETTELEDLLREISQAVLKICSVTDETEDRIYGLAILLKELPREQIQEALGRLDVFLPLSNDGLDALAAVKNMAEENKRLQELAVTDTLTGLYNVRHFRERLAMELERVSRMERPCSLIMIDLDHFKEVNDSYGHPAGDELLQNVADILRFNIRSIDVAVRYGGDELAVIAPDTDSGAAARIAERIRHVLETSPHTSPYGVTGSFGVATHYPFGHDTMESLTERADQALYESKRQGGNSVWFFEADVKEKLKTEVTTTERDDLYFAIPTDVD